MLKTMIQKQMKDNHRFGHILSEQDKVSDSYHRYFKYNIIADQVFNNALVHSRTSEANTLDLYYIKPSSVFFAYVRNYCLAKTTMQAKALSLTCFFTITCIHLVYFHTRFLVTMFK